MARLNPEGRRWSDQRRRRRLVTRGLLALALLELLGLLAIHPIALPFSQ